MHFLYERNLRFFFAVWAFTLQCLVDSLMPDQLLVFCYDNKRSVHKNVSSACHILKCLQLRIHEKLVNMKDEVLHAP